MGATISVSTEINAAPDQVFAMVSDLNRMGEWSPEAQDIEWLHGATSAVPGATFKGSNRHGSKSWTTAGKVTEVEPARRFAFRITAVGMKIAEWRYDLEPTHAGCTVTETWIDQRGALAKMLGKLATGVEDREAHNRDTMAATLAALKSAAEAVPPPA